ncbi:MAG: hypothetical protein ACLQIB_30335 [Isosphaeraceae bacterium]
MQAVKTYVREDEHGVLRVGNRRLMLGGLACEAMVDRNGAIADLAKCVARSLV